MAYFSLAKTTRKMHQMSPNCTIFQKFSGGACPRTPLAKLRAFGARFRTFGAQKWSHQYEIRCYGPARYRGPSLQHHTALRPPRELPGRRYRRYGGRNLLRTSAIIKWSCSIKISATETTVSLRARVILRLK